MGWIKQIYQQEQRIKYSQNGEEYRLEFIFDNIGETNRIFVDVGAWDGIHLSNTKLFSDKGWKGLLIDGKDFPGVVKSFVTVDNILETLTSNNIPVEFDFLSIDIDGNDYWILKKILSQFKPRVIVSEFNSEHPIEESKTIKYNPDFKFDNYSDYYGYTYGAGLKLAAEFGYTIIYQQSNMNLFYLRNDLVTETPSFPVQMFRHWNQHSELEWVWV